MPERDLRVMTTPQHRSRPGRAPLLWGCEDALKSWLFILTDYRCILPSTVKKLYCLFTHSHQARRGAIGDFAMQHWHACVCACLCGSMLASAPRSRWHGGSSDQASAIDGGGGRYIDDVDLRARISKLKKKSTSGGMAEEEYLHAMRYIRDHAPQRLLVWGLGYDSLLLAKLNRGGQTLFLEPNVDWVAKVAPALQRLNFSAYDGKLFKTSVGTWRTFVESPNRVVGVLDDAPCFDTVIVDSPAGINAWDIGRAAPIYTAWADTLACARRGAYPAARAVTVFVHDCWRELEDQVSMRFFTKRTLIGETSPQVGGKRLREFRVKEAGAPGAVVDT